MAKDKNVYVMDIAYDEFKSFVPAGEQDIPRCKGKPLNWTAPMNIETDEDDVGMPEADISLLNVGSFVISAQLKEQLGPLVSEGCELLPLNFQGREMFLVNVVRVLDCLDKEQSIFNEFGGVSKIVFDSDKLPGSGLFKIKEDNCTSIFCSEDVYQRMTELALTGIEFDSVMVG